MTALDMVCFMKNSVPDVSIARARVKAGVTTKLHRLKGVVERYVILSGMGKVEVSECEPQQVSKGDVVVIPSLCPQRITNIGTEDLVFLAICTPRFTEQVYENMDYFSSKLPCKL